MNETEMLWTLFIHFILHELLTEQMLSCMCPSYRM